MYDLPLSSLLVAGGGLGHLALAIGSIAIPRVLNWKAETDRLGPLTRQVFWTYAYYIWATNIAFGLLSLFFCSELSDGSPLSRAIAAFIAIYWAARIGVQCFYFDRASAPPGALFKLAEVGLFLLFGYMTAVYAWVALG